METVCTDITRFFEFKSRIRNAPVVVCHLSEEAGYILGEDILTPGLNLVFCARLPNSMAAKICAALAGQSLKLNQLFR